MCSRCKERAAGVKRRAAGVKTSARLCKGIGAVRCGDGDAVEKGLLASQRLGTRPGTRSRIREARDQGLTLAEQQGPRGARWTRCRGGRLPAHRVQASFCEFRLGWHMRFR